MSAKCTHWRGWVLLRTSCYAYHYNPSSGIFSVHLSCTLRTVFILHLHIIISCPTSLWMGNSYYPSVPVGEVKHREWHFWKLFSAVKSKQSRYANTSKPSSWYKHSDKITEAKLGPVLFIIIQCFLRDSTEISINIQVCGNYELLNIWISNGRKPSTVETLLNQSKSDSPCPW